MFNIFKATDVIKMIPGKPAMNVLVYALAVTGLNTIYVTLDYSLAMSACHSLSIGLSSSYEDAKPIPHTLGKAG